MSGIIGVDRSILYSSVKFCWRLVECNCARELAVSISHDRREVSKGCKGGEEGVGAHDIAERKEKLALNALSG